MLPELLCNVRYDNSAMNNGYNTTVYFECPYCGKVNNIAVTLKSYKLINKIILNTTCKYCNHYFDHELYKVVYSSKTSKVIFWSDSDTIINNIPYLNKITFWKSSHEIAFSSRTNTAFTKTKSICVDIYPNSGRRVIKRFYNGKLIKSSVKYVTNKELRDISIIINFNKLVNNLKEHNYLLFDIDKFTDDDIHWLLMHVRHAYKYFILSNILVKLPDGTYKRLFGQFNKSQRRRIRRYAKKYNNVIPFEIFINCLIPRISNKRIYKIEDIDRVFHYFKQNVLARNFNYSLIFSDIYLRYYNSADKLTVDDIFKNILTCYACI